MDAVRGDHVTTTEFLLYKCGVSQYMCILSDCLMSVLFNYHTFLFFFKASLDAEDILGRKAIHHAAQAGALGSLRCIIGAGADVNQPASVNNITPLHYAAKVISMTNNHNYFPNYGPIMTLNFDFRPLPFTLCGAFYKLHTCIPLLQLGLWT